MSLHSTYNMISGVPDPKSPSQDTMDLLLGIKKTKDTKVNVAPKLKTIQEEIIARETALLKKIDFEREKNTKETDKLEAIKKDREGRLNALMSGAKEEQTEKTQRKILALESDLKESDIQISKLPEKLEISIAEARAEAEKQIKALKAKSEIPQSVDTNINVEDELKEFLSTYSASPALGKHLFGAKFESKAEEEKDDLDRELERSLKGFSENSGYFDHENDLDCALYKACYAVCMHRAKFIEHNDLDEVASRAYNMMVLFSPEPVDNLTKCLTTLHESNNPSINEVLKENGIDFSSDNFKKQIIQAIGTEEKVSDAVETFLEKIHADLSKKLGYQEGANENKLPVEIDPIEIFNRHNARSTFKNVDRFAQSNPTLGQPTHDILMYKLPDYQMEDDDPTIVQSLDFKLDIWKSKIQDLGMPVIRNFTDVPKIENLIRKKIKEENVGTATHQIEELVEKEIKALTQVQFEALKKDAKYDHCDQNQELADLCMYYKSPEKTFDKALQLMADKTLNVDDTGKKLAPKDPDHIPDIAIKVPPIPPATESDIYMVKLPSHNPRALILGDITNCCQSVAGDSEKCVIDGVNLANNGFYVFIKGGKDFDPNYIDWDKFNDKKDRIIGQSYVWRGKDGALTLDSIEVMESFRNKIDIAKTMQEFGNAVCEKDPSVSRIMLGVGGGTQAVIAADVNREFVASQSEFPEGIKTGYMYRDAENQYEMYVSPKLQNDKNELRAKCGNDFVEHIVSFEQADLLKALDIDDEFLALHEDVKNILITPAAMRGYNNRYFTFDQIKDMEIDKIKALTSESAYNCFRDKYFTFDQIKDMEADKTKALTSESAYNCFRDKYLDFDQIKDMEIDKMKALTSESAYNKMKALTSESAYNCFRDKYFTFDQIKDMEIDKINALTSESAYNCFRDKYFTFDQIKDMEADKIKAFATSASYYGFRDKYFDFDQIKDMEIDKINVLTDTYAVGCFQGGFCEFDQIKNMETDKIKALTSFSAYNCFCDKYFDFDQIKDMEIDKINALTDTYAVGCFQEGFCEFDQIKNMETDKIKALTSKSAYYGFCDKYFDFDQIKNLTLDEINALTSDHAISAYAGGMTFADYAKSQNIDLSQKDVSRDAVINAAKSIGVNLASLVIQSTSEKHETINIETIKENLAHNIVQDGGIVKEAPHHEQKHAPGEQVK